MAKTYKLKYHLGVGFVVSVDKISENDINKIEKILQTGKGTINLTGKINKRQIIPVNKILVVEIEEEY